MKLLPDFLTMVFVGFLFLAPNIAYIVSGPSLMGEEMLHVDNGNSYEVADPIIITTERTFELTGWTGSGTAEDPYLLERVHITSNGDGPYYGAITISDVDCYFVIRDCIISGLNQGRGLWFSNLAHASVVNCLFNNTSPAMYMFNCNNTKILNNTIFGRDGMTICVSEDVEISHNHIRGGNRGIHSEVLDNVSIFNNTILYCDVGIYHLGANGSILDNIVAGSEDIGIWIEDRWGNNSIYGNHIGFSGEYNAKDDSFGIRNMWDDGESAGNRWSDLGDDDMYSIPGDAGSVDRYPSHYTIDVLGPSIVPETYPMYEYMLDSPDNSFTFQADVEDESGIDIVLLYAKYRDEEGWKAYEMERSSIPENTYPYHCTIKNLRTGNLDFYLWANDTLGNWDISRTYVIWVEIPGQRFIITILPSIMVGVAVIGIAILCKVLSRRKNRVRDV